MIVSRGGKLLEGDGYKAIKGTFLVKNEVLGGMLKESFNKSLLKLNKEGGLKLPVRIRTGRGIEAWVESQKEKYWIVNIEKPLEEVIQIVNYVGRYTKRACISEYKIESISPNIVFRSKDYKNSKRGEKALEILKVMTPTVFLDKLLQHVPEKRYRMVRYSGMYNSYYISKIPKELRAQVSKESIEKEEELGGGIELESMRSYLISKGYKDLLSCCYCNGQMKVVGIVNKEGELRTFDKNVP
jgi:hypothetical protein